MTDNSVQEIIVAVADNPLGVISLMSILLSAIAMTFFREALERTRLVVFVILILGVAGVVYATITSAPSEIRYADLESENKELRNEIEGLKDNNCNSWDFELARFREDTTNSWKQDVESKLNAARPKRGQVFATISTARSQPIRTDIHFMWCKSGGGPEWTISETDQKNWKSALQSSGRGSTPIGFFEGPDGKGTRLWFLVPKQ